MSSHGSEQPNEFNGVVEQTSYYFRQMRKLSGFLLAGTVVALIWANLDHTSYEYFVEAPLFESTWLNPEGGHISFHFLVNDLFMVLFFGIAMKEVSESFLPGGALSSLRKAAMPAVATAGGVVGPVAVFFGLHALVDPRPSFLGGWAIPTATDIAYCWLFASWIFGRRHPAVSFLLVLAVLDDLIGMSIIATFYASGIHVPWLGLVAVGMLACEVFRRNGVTSFWPYILVGGPLVWIGLMYTGVHAALALVPVVPFMPHAERDSGMFEGFEKEASADTMNRFEHVFEPIVDVGLFGFGLANAGVLLTGDAFASPATWVIFTALLVGKTGGIWLFCAVGNRFGLELPECLDLRQTVVLGMVAAVGFTVALFVTSVAIDTGKVPEQLGGMLKLGALLSFAAGPLAMLVSKMMRVRQVS